MSEYNRQRAHIVVAIIAALIVAAACLDQRAHAETWPHEMPPPKFEAQLWDAAKVAAQTPAESIRCMQVRTRGATALCITENQWHLMHEHDR